MERLRKTNDRIVKAKRIPQGYTEINFLGKKALMKDSYLNAYSLIFDTAALLLLIFGIMISYILVYYTVY